MAIFEVPKRNSGILGGRFMRRQRTTYKPGTNKLYSDVDMYVGNTIEMHGNLFELLEADEWTLKWMDINPTLYPRAHFEGVLEKVQCFDHLLRGI